MANKLYMVQQGYPSVEIDNTEKDCILIWQNERIESNVVIVDRKNIQLLISLLNVAHTHTPAVSRKNFCAACSAQRHGVKTRIAIPHNCELKQDVECTCRTWAAKEHCLHYDSVTRECCKKENLQQQKF